MDVRVNVAAISLLSVIAFLVGWFIFGLLGAVLLAIIVMVLMGIITFTPGKSMKCPRGYVRNSSGKCVRSQ